MQTNSTLRSGGKSVRSFLRTFDRTFIRIGRAFAARGVLSRALVAPAGLESTQCLLEFK
jgi:hypothetical protein